MQKLEYTALEAHLYFASLWNIPLKELTTLCSVEISLKDDGSYLRIPTPRPSSADLLKSANVSLPKVLPHVNTTEVTRKKLQNRRKG